MSWSEEFFRNGWNGQSWTVIDRRPAVRTEQDFHQLSYTEIAEALGISYAAAKKQGRRMEDVIRPLLERFSHR